MHCAARQVVESGVLAIAYYVSGIHAKAGRQGRCIENAAATQRRIELTLMTSCSNHTVSYLITAANVAANIRLQGHPQAIDPAPALTLSPSQGRPVGEGDAPPLRLAYHASSIRHGLDDAGVQENTENSRKKMGLVRLASAMNVHLIFGGHSPIAAPRHLAANTRAGQSRVGTIPCDEWSRVEPTGLLRSMPIGRLMMTAIGGARCGRPCGGSVVAHSKREFDEAQKLLGQPPRSTGKVEQLLAASLQISRP